jgi:hypothetical protein
MRLLLRGLLPSNKPLEWTGRHMNSAGYPKLVACHSGAAFDVQGYNAASRFALPN